MTTSMNKSFSNKVFDVSNYLGMFILSLAFLYPFWYILAISLNDNSVISYQQIWLFPKAFTLLNYEAVFSDNQILSGYKITILRAIIGTVCTVMANSLVAYALSKKYLIGRKIFMLIITITMFFSGGLIPSYLLYMRLHLLDNFAVYIIPGLLGAWTIIVMKTYFTSTIAASIEESARIDGANDLLIFFKIIIPLAMPMIATMSLFSMVGIWNDWWTGEIMVNSRNLKPVQTVLLKVINQADALDSMKRISGRSNVAKSAMSAESVKMAAVIVVTAPILIIYPFCQKYFANGIMIGSIKE